MKFLSASEKALPSTSDRAMGGAGAAGACQAALTHVSHVLAANIHRRAELTDEEPLPRCASARRRGAILGTCDACCEPLIVVARSASHPI